MSATYHVITYGCQMNKNDSQRLNRVFLDMGMKPTKRAQEADVIILNTCSVRKSAEDRVFGKVHNFKKLKKKNPSLIVGVTGCMPGRDRDGVLEKTMGADLFFPIEDMVKLPEWLASLNPELVNSGELESDYLKLHPIREQTRQAYVTIQTGCNKFCTYCVVPFARGFERNRSVRDILEEIRRLAECGCVEITLLGQTVNSFVACDPECFSSVNPYSNHFAALLWEVNQIKGIERIHFTAPHPLHMDDEIIDAMQLPKHVNFLHLPVQAGDNDILRKMNRRHAREDYIALVDHIYKKIPDLALGTDIIVGYCGETKEQFDQTVDLYRQCNFDISYTAMYSPRTGTTGHKVWADDVSYEEKKYRWEYLQDVMREIVLKKNQVYVGNNVSVLVDSFKSVEGQDTMGWCVGNSREMKRVQFPGTKEMVGNIYHVEIAEAKEWILFGRLI